MGEWMKAKQAWEKALEFFPADDVAHRNLVEYIYGHFEFERQ